MKKIEILTLIFSSFLFLNANLLSNESILLNGTVSGETIDFSIENTSNSPVEVAYIVIQDNVLMREQGRAAIGGGSQLIIPVSINVRTEKTYELQVTVEGESGFTKVFTIQK